MIDGIDIVVVGQTHPDDLTFLLRRIVAAWPHAVYHGVSAKDPGELATLSAGLPDDPEVFVYEDHSAFESWERDGAGESSTRAMLHILVSRDSLTLVADRADSKLGTFAIDLAEALRTERLLTPRSALLSRES